MSERTSESEWLEFEADLAAEILRMMDSKGIITHAWHGPNTDRLAARAAICVLRAEEECQEVVLENELPRKAARKAVRK